MTFLDDMVTDFEYIVNAEFSEPATITYEDTTNQVVGCLFNTHTEETDLNLQAEVVAEKIHIIIAESNLDQALTTGCTINVRGENYNIYEIDSYDKNQLLVWLD